MFAFALVAGIVAWSLAPERRRLWREGLGLSFAVAAILFAPFVAWNATHHWITFVFAFEQRHQSQPSLLRPLFYLAANAGAYSPGLWLAALLVLVRPRNALIGWTAVPLTALLILLNFHERIELHWIFGPYVSLCVGMGIAFESLSHRARVLWATAGAVPAAVLIPFLFLAAAFPGPLYEQFRATGSSLRNDGPFEIFTYWPLAQDVRRMADANDAVVVTDGYGFSSQMDYEAGIPPVVLGGADFDRRLHMACGEVKPGPDLEYSYTDPTGHSVPARTYYLTWCDDPRPDAIRILRWENPGATRTAAG